MGTPDAMLPRGPQTLAELSALVGQEIGPTAWRDVTQERVDAFADATDDHQWIHVDPERAAASPLGGTIAHGLYSLSLGPALSRELVSFEAFAYRLNYGYDRVRFPAPLPVGSRLRARLTIMAVEDVPGGVQVRSRLVFECDRSEKPVAVAESLVRVII